MGNGNITENQVGCFVWLPAPRKKEKKSKGPAHLKGIIMPTLLAPKILSLHGRDILQNSKAERSGQPPIPPIEQDVVLLPARILIAIEALYHCIPEPDACQAASPPPPHRHPEIKVY